MAEKSFTIASTIKKYPRFPYQEIKEAVLGKTYTLTLAFVGTKRAQQLNQFYRQKSYVPDVLSFPLDKTAGEIYICPEIAYPKAKDYNLSKSGHIAFLFIHGLLHLKGYDHGATMEKLEQKYLKQFKIK